jgi:hypothetical protein
MRSVVWLILVVLLFISCSQRVRLSSDLDANDKQVIYLVASDPIVIHNEVQAFIEKILGEQQADLVIVVEDRSTVSIPKEFNWIVSNLNSKLQYVGAIQSNRKFYRHPESKPIMFDRVKFTLDSPVTFADKSRSRSTLQIIYLNSSEATIM